MRHPTRTSDDGQRPVRIRSLLGTVLLVSASLGMVLSGCGDDDAATTTTAATEEAFCDATAQLRTDVSDLSSMEVSSGGVDAITAQLDKVEGDAEDLANASSGTASSEIDDLRGTVDSLGTALDALNSDPNPQALAIVVSDIGQTVTATQAVLDRLSDACD